MSFRVILRREAEADIAEAAAWYENERNGLGAEFTEATIAAIDGLSENPLLVSRRHRKRNIRWIRPERFPYRVVYEVADDTVLVLCVLHFARDDRRWRDRLGE